MTDNPGTIIEESEENIDGLDAVGADSGPPASDEASGHKGKSWIRISILLVVPLLLALVGGYFWLTSGRYVSTDNAYVQRDMVSVASEVTGTITAVHVTENQQVHAGDLLFEIDDRPFRVALAQANAQIASARVQVAELQARSSGTNADIVGAQANLRFAQQDLARYENLNQRGFVSHARYQEAVHAVAEAQERLANAQANARTASSALAQGGVGNQPALQAALAAREAALLNLERTQVRATTDGYVTQADRLQVGNTVVSGVPVVTIVRSDAIWVQANFKETDLTNMTVGQPVAVEVDAYPDLEVTGHVASIGVGTGSEFSLLPAQNANGNWVKVTQRVPVRIGIDESSGRVLIAGLSVDVTVDTEPPAGQPRDTASASSER